MTVLRQGRVSGEMDAPFDTDGLMEMMFGEAPVPPSCACLFTGEDVLMMRGVSASGGRTGLRDCNIVIRQGEVVGLAGLEGSGQEVFLRIAAGLASPSEGEVRVQGMKMSGKTHHWFKHVGVSFLPGSRMEEGLVPGLTITEHLALLDFW